jgi:di/tripeptidase
MSDPSAAEMAGRPAMPPTWSRISFTSWENRAVTSPGSPSESRPKVKFESRLDYYPFRLPDNAPVVQRACRAVESLGGKPTVKVANGGLDANWIVRHGVPTVTLGAGQNAIHTVDEWVDLTDFVAGCRLAVALATS